MRLESALAAIIIVLCFTGTIAAQAPQPRVEPCAVTIDEAPAIRGLRLGQVYGELQSVLPRRYDILGEKPDELGITRVSLSADLLSDPKKLDGVRSLSLAYFDNSLVSINIEYSIDVAWQSNLHFVAALAEQLKLPRQGWQQKDGAIMPTILLIDTRFADKAVKRMAEVEESKRRGFRP